MSVAFLGPRGTYSHQAALELFGGSRPLLPCSSIAGVFDAVDRRHAEKGVVPIRNSTAGPVAETKTELCRSSIHVESEEYALKIGHSLMRRRGAQSKVQRIYSHEQALQQCATYLETHYSAAKAIPVSSTAAAAEMASRDDEAIAICSSVCAQLYKLDVLAPDIQDAGAENTTYFITIVKAGAE